MTTELNPDQKGHASLTFGDVVVKTRNNFPDPNYHPESYYESSYYHLHQIRTTKRFGTATTADGIGTKPELAERLCTLNQKLHGIPNFSYFESLPFDHTAMVEGDVIRFGHFLLGITQIVDVNVATDGVINALARGSQNVSDVGGFPLLNGETAELRHRTSGYGDTHINLNAVGTYLVNKNKVITGDQLKPGQPIYGFKETSFRSNGNTRNMQILEAAFLNNRGYPSKLDYVMANLSQFLGENLGFDTESLRNVLNVNKTVEFMNQMLGHDFLEQVLLPWHEDYPDITQELLQPSTLYGRIIYDAQGGIDGERLIPLTGIAHISGGGIPEKVGRLVKPRGLGAHIDPVFPDPKGTAMIIALANSLPKEQRDKLISSEIACRQWGRGFGMVAVTSEETDDLQKIGRKYGVEIDQVGEIIKKPVIEFYGHTFSIPD